MNSDLDTRAKTTILNELIKNQITTNDTLLTLSNRIGIRTRENFKRKRQHNTKSKNKNQPIRTKQKSVFSRNN